MPSDDAFKATYFIDGVKTPMIDDPSEDEYLPPFIFNGEEG